MDEEKKSQIVNEADILKMQYTGQRIPTKAENEQKYSEFIKRISAFSEITTLEEAKSLAKKILPVKLETTRFRVGAAKCVVINKEDVFRISVDSPESFICYNFT